MEPSKYQYLMTDEYNQYDYLEHNESYSAFSFGDIQFFVNLNDFEAPIFQPSKIQNPYASLIGNYCISDSSILFINKVDPIFVAIRLLRNKLANEQQAKSIEFENIFDNEDTFQIYLSKCRSIRENFDSISITKEVGDELYVKLDKGRLFQFLDIKYNNIRQYSQQGIYFVNDCNQKKQDEFELQACILFKQYMGDQLFNEFEAARKLIVHNQITNSNVVIDQVHREEKADRGDKENQQKRNTNQEKQKASETKTLEAGKKCHKLDSFCIKNKDCNIQLEKDKIHCNSHDQLLIYLFILKNSLNLSYLGNFNQLLFNLFIKYKFIEPLLQLKIIKIILKQFITPNLIKYIKYSFSFLKKRSERKEFLFNQMMESELSQGQGRWE